MKHLPVWPFLLSHKDSLRLPIFESAKGTKVFDTEGKKYLCATSGLWNVNFGYGLPSVSEAIQRALEECSYSSLFRQRHKWAEYAASALLEAVGCSKFTRVIYATSGGAAVDLAMKIARHWAYVVNGPRKNIVIGLKGSYHGLTYGAFSVTDSGLGQGVYSVDNRFVRHVDPNDSASFKELIDRIGDRVCAVLVEPLLGSGAIEVSHSLIGAILQYSQRYNYLVIADEVATGFYRLGTISASIEWSRAPDMLIFSKGLTNGTQAASSILINNRVTDVFENEDHVLVHGETQAGTPASCAAIMAVIEYTQRSNAEAMAHQVSNWLAHELNLLQEKFGEQIKLSGRGNFRGIQITHAPAGENASKVLVAKALKHGVIVQPGINGIQLIPSLASSQEDIAGIGELVQRVLEEYLDECRS